MTRLATRVLDDTEVTLRKIKGQRGLPVSTISESGLYKIVLRAHSSNPEAKAFQDWVTQDVLPAIRKDGGYVMGEEKVSAGEMTEDQFIRKAYEMLMRKTERLEVENKAMGPELNFVSVAEYVALNHVYLSRFDRQLLGKFATDRAISEGVEVLKTRRTVTGRGGAQYHSAVRLPPHSMQG